MVRSRPPSRRAAAAGAVGDAGADPVGLDAVVAIVDLGVEQPRRAAFEADHRFAIAAVAAGRDRHAARARIGLRPADPPPARLGERRAWPSKPPSRPARSRCEPSSAPPPARGPRAEAARVLGGYHSFSKCRNGFRPGARSRYRAGKDEDPRSWPTPTPRTPTRRRRRRSRRPASRTCSIGPG